MQPSLLAFQLVAYHFVAELKVQNRKTVIYGDTLSSKPVTKKSPISVIANRAFFCFMALEFDTKVFDNQVQVLQAAATMDGELGKRLRESIFVELKGVRDRIVSGIKFDNGDPRGTAHSVKRYVAKKYLGGVVSILDGKSSGGTNSFNAPRKVYPGMKGQRGGNRMLRSQRTQQILDYPPDSRGFILRFVNSGTHPRYANGRNGKWDRRGNNSTFFKLQEQGDYYRGNIAPRNFFGTLGNMEMQKAVANLSKIIDEEFNKLFQ